MSNDDSETAPDSPASDTTGSGTRLERILLIDDSLTVRAFAAEVLRDAGYRVTAVADAATGLAELANQLPDLVLLDVRLPGTDPADVAAALRERDPRGRTVLLLYSGKRATDLAQLATRCQAHGYFQKTDDPQRLLRIVADTWAEQQRGPGFSDHHDET